MGGPGMGHDGPRMGGPDGMRMGGPDMGRMGGPGGPVSLLDMPDIPRPDEMTRSEYPLVLIILFRGSSEASIKLCTILLDFQTFMQWTGMKSVKLSTVKLEQLCKTGVNLRMSSFQSKMNVLSPRRAIIIHPLPNRPVSEWGFNLHYSVFNIDLRPT